MSRTHRYGSDYNATASERIRRRLECKIRRTYNTLAAVSPGASDFQVARQTARVCKCRVERVLETL